jgi:hypothetical protein
MIIEMEGFPLRSTRKKILNVQESSQESLNNRLTMYSILKISIDSLVMVDHCHDIRYRCVIGEKKE